MIYMIWIKMHVIYFKWTVIWWLKIYTSILWKGECYGLLIRPTRQLTHWWSLYSPLWWSTPALGWWYTVSSFDQLGVPHLQHLYRGSCSPFLEVKYLAGRDKKKKTLLDVIKQSTSLQLYIDSEVILSRKMNALRCGQNLKRDAWVTSFYIELVTSEWTLISPL